MYIFVKKILLFLTFFLVHPKVVFAHTDKVIYDEDNRVLVSELNSSSQVAEIEMSRSVFAQIPKWRISHSNNETISIQTKSLAAGLNFCPTEKFSSLPLVSSCSAFLVAPDLILTAGHCLKDKYECQKNIWVLDYDDSSGFYAPNGSVVFNRENIFSCKKIISWVQNSKLDYALIQLNRDVLDRDPLLIRKSGKIQDNDSLLVIGHPFGMPKVLVSDAFIRNNVKPYTFVTNADTFSGNSGSPVINTKTNLVEGILIKGDQDYKMNLNLGCNESIHCIGNECRGETVLRSTVLPLNFIP